MLILFSEHVSPLIYFGQSGALNVHISDVFGIMIKQRFEDETSELMPFANPITFTRRPIIPRLARANENPSTTPRNITVSGYPIVMKLARNLRCWLVLAAWINSRVLLRLGSPAPPSPFLPMTTSD